MDLESFFGSLTLCGEEDEKLGLCFFSSLLNRLSLVSFNLSYRFLPYYGL